ncbi:glycosyltransferase [Paracoccus sp. SJTW-4]|uniref:glycosyltransferase n=1 Tax=Paracoccus sp. SJTW-4 TaxID=3078428 RepID=UPI0039E85F16
MDPMNHGQVTVLLALYRGAAFLPAQLDSIAAQDADWRLVVSDDHPDAGAAIVRRFAAAHQGRVELHAGPGRGAAANFLSMLAALPAQPGFVALSDQDDVWLAGKLSRALAALHAAGEAPALYCSRATICDAGLRPLGLTPAPRHPPSFRHALVQNLVQGNTAVLNPAAAALARQAAQGAGAGDGVRAVVMHDWWLYQLVSGAGGRVIWDPHPSLLYRQHGGNVVGANAGLRARLASVRRMLLGRHRDWSLATLHEMQRLRPLLTPEHRAVLDDFAALCGPGAGARLRALRRGGFHRRDAPSQALLWLAAALGRV